MDNPIGIFDSGIGGLTVVKQLINLLPNENLIYFGDTARFPYGTRSDKLIKQYALEDAAFLQQFDIKLLIVACNTASAVAVDFLKSILPIPVTGVIQPGAEAALRATKLKRIGVIGSTATVKSNAYGKVLLETDPDSKVFGQPCPILVPLIEEGWLDEEVTRLTIRKYLAPLLAENIDTLILGCTHFPVISGLIQQESGDKIALIDAGKETAKHVKNVLETLDLRRKELNKGDFQFNVSDISEKFNDIGTRFIGHAVVNAQRVDFDNFLMEQGNKIYESMNTYL